MHTPVKLNWEIFAKISNKVGLLSLFCPTITPRNLYTRGNWSTFYSVKKIIEGLVLIMMEELTYKQIPPALHRQVQQDNVLRWEMYRTKERKFHKDLLRSLR